MLRLHSLYSWSDNSCSSSGGRMRPPTVTVGKEVLSMRRDRGTAQVDAEGEVVADVDADDEVDEDDAVERERLERLQRLDMLERSMEWRW